MPIADENKKLEKCIQHYNSVVQDVDLDLPLLQGQVIFEVKGKGVNRIYYQWVWYYNLLIVLMHTLTARHSISMKVAYDCVIACNKLLQLCKGCRNADSGTFPRAVKHLSTLYICSTL